MGDLVGVVGIIVCNMSLGLGTRLCVSRVCVAMVFIGGVEVEVVPGNMLVVALRHPAQERGEKCDEMFQLAARHDIHRCGGQNDSGTDERVRMKLLNILHSGYIGG